MSMLCSACEEDVGSATPVSAAASRASLLPHGQRLGRASGASAGCQVWRATPMMQAARGSAGNVGCGQPRGLAGHGNGAVGDDVLLDLAGAAADGGVTLEGVEAGPLAPVDRVGSAAGQEAGRAEQVDRQFGERLRHGGPRPAWRRGPRASSSRPS